MLSFQSLISILPKFYLSKSTTKKHQSAIIVSIKNIRLTEWEINQSKHVKIPKKRIKERKNSKFTEPHQRFEKKTKVKEPNQWKQKTKNHIPHNTQTSIKIFRNSPLHQSPFVLTMGCGQQFWVRQINQFKIPNRSSPELFFFCTFTLVSTCLLLFFAKNWKPTLMRLVCVCFSVSITSCGTAHFPG